jgi:hypothetical protein
MTFHFGLFRHQLYDRIGGINSEFNRAEDYDFCLWLSEITQFYHSRNLFTTIGNLRSIPFNSNLTNLLNLSQLLHKRFKDAD